MVRDERAEGWRQVAITLSPRERTWVVSARPRLREEPVMNQTRGWDDEQSFVGESITW